MHSFPIATIEQASTIRIHDGKALLIPYQFGSGKRFWLQEWNLSDSKQVRQKWDIAAPRGKRILEYVPSPDNKHAVWVMGTPGRKPLTDSGYPHRAISVWHSDLHGEHMKEMGILSMGKEGDLYQYFGGLMWNPDSKNVSFVFRRNLYKIRAVD